MPWDSVPWFTEGGAEHSSEVARLMAYAAFGKAEGVVGAGDLQVKALTAPTAAVQVTTGACAIVNRAAGSPYQAYAARLPTGDQVLIAATGVSARSDLIVARIENPYSFGETWPDPSNPKVGPYVFTRVISGVPKTTTSVRQVRPNDSAITLARIDIPANNKWHNWPGEPARWSIDVPLWATRVKIITTLAGFRLTRSDVYARMQNVLGTVLGQDTGIDDDQGTGTRRSTIVLADNFAVPAAMRGTAQNLFLQTYMTKSESGDVSVDSNTSIVADVEFVEAPDEDEV